MFSNRNRLVFSCVCLSFLSQHSVLPKILAILCNLSYNTRRPDPGAMFRLAIGSYVEQYSNVVAIIKKKEGDLFQAAEFDHPYPCTKVMWSPDVRLGATDLLATTGDYLRLWSVGEDAAGNMSVHKEALLNNNKTSEYCAPLTSFDWCEADSIVATSSIDTTGRCAILLVDVIIAICINQRIAHLAMRVRRYSYNLGCWHSNCQDTADRS